MDGIGVQYVKVYRCEVCRERWIVASDEAGIDFGLFCCVAEAHLLAHRINEHEMD